MTWQKFISDKYTLWGLILLSLSISLFVATDLTPAITGSGPMGIFLLHYAFTAIYFFAVLFSWRLGKGKNGLPLVVITLLLLLISAYALNREMHIFEDSTTWLQVALPLLGINLIITSLTVALPDVWRKVQLVLLTLSALLFIYLAIYLVPIYFFGAIGIIAIGIGLHAFVPLLLFIYNLRIFRRIAKDFKPAKLLAGTTVVLVILFLTLYSIQWNLAKNRMEQTYLGATKPGKTAWSAWVETLQNLPNGPLTERILKGDIVYATPGFDEGFTFFELPGKRWDEPKKHDPLVMIASFFSGNFNIPVEDRIRMLQTMHDNRYGAEERLWSGANLKTLHMNTEVQIWPTMHLAYAEKTITVANQASKKGWRGNQQEAIYIFQLPEGAVVTSLSLWINGREEKSVLTSKGLAEEAYTTIVGKEARDPSVVHWLEGNRVSVRVFPVMAGEQRIFKIGITLPLPEHDGKTWYENFTFIGPDAKNATENVRVRLMEQSGGNLFPVALKRETEKLFTYEGAYRPDLSLAFPSEEVTPHHFVHKGETFTLEKYIPQTEPAQFDAIYADVNAAWTKDDWNKLLAIAGDRSVYVLDEERILINGENEAEVFNKLQKRKLTVFPFYLIRDPGTSLVVTKGAGNTPSLKDLEQSLGYEALMHAASKGHRYFVFQAGETSSLYLNSLRELRMFRYAQGSLSGLADYLKMGYFTADGEKDGRVILYNAGLTLTRSGSPAITDAPDHLLRLYAYNYIMQQGGPGMLADTSLQESRLAELGKYAHIVTPLNSMIVLERKEDYQRFGIDKNHEGLQNASTQNSGAVPEPHEWAIIIVCLGILLYMYQTNKTKPIWLKK